MSAVLPRVPVCPIPLADESLSSWLDRTACFYGCDLERWVGQFTADFCGYGADIDLDRSDELRFTIGKWSGVPAHRLPPSLTGAGHWLPKAGRLAFCDDCWDQDVRNGISHIFGDIGLNGRRFIALSTKNSCVKKIAT